MNKNKTTYLEGFDHGYRLGSHLDKLSLSLKTRLKGFLRPQRFSLYQEGVAAGYEHGKQELLKRHLYEKRMAALEQQRGEKGKEQELSQSPEKDR